MPFNTVHDGHDDVVCEEQGPIVNDGQWVIVREEQGPIVDDGQDVVVREEQAPIVDDGQEVVVREEQAPIVDDGQDVVVREEHSPVIIISSSCSHQTTFQQSNNRIDIVSQPVPDVKKQVFDLLMNNLENNDINWNHIKQAFLMQNAV